MKFKLSFDEPDFFVNEEKGVVTCVMDCYLKGVDSVLNAMANNVYGYYNHNPIVSTFTITASAKLDPQDKFDKEKGKKVARAKAESKAYKRISKSFCHVIEKYCEKLGNDLAEFETKAVGVIEHNDRYIGQF